MVKHKQKTRNRFVLVLLTLVMFLSITTIIFAIDANRFRQSVLLSANQAQIFTSGFGAHHGRSSVSNHAGSAGAVYCSLQGSTGSGWSVWSTVHADPGMSTSTATWGRHDTSYLVRTRVFVPSINGFIHGRIATGYIYTD